MTQPKNISQTHLTPNKDRPNSKTNEDNFSKDRSQEVDLPIPEKKNDDITTGINGEKPEKNTGQTGFKPEITDKEKNQEKKEKGTPGFDPRNTSENEKKEKRGDENERLERDDTTDPKTKDAKWQQEKMNEANNQQGLKQNVDKAARLNDTRNDSILDRPKTETYERKEGENIGGTIKKENYRHQVDEKRRDEINRKNTAKSEKQY